MRYFDADITHKINLGTAYVRRWSDGRCLTCTPPLELGRNQHTMRKYVKKPGCLNRKYRAGTAAFPLWVQDGRTTITLPVVLFSSCILAVQSSAHIGIWIDRPIEITSAETITPDDPHLLDSSRVNRPGSRAGVDHPTCRTAEQLYEAASADARTLERAIFISELRQEVERALGKRLSDDELRTLADQAREEAHKWYKYIQTSSRCAGWHGEIVSWPNRYSSRTDLNLRLPQQGCPEAAMIPAYPPA